ncbi:MAG: glycosyltransferase family 2 protein [Deltaproteobacteria bacterium]|nr:glycosyltransferase family 2 protein [Deltaproteobacteria bacterium]
MPKAVATTVIIPALNEEATIGKVLDAIPALADKVIVVDNGSRDRTAEIAAQRGVEVVFEPQRGYGNACLAAMATLAPTGNPDAPVVVVFMDGDFSDDPTEMSRLVAPIIEKGYDLVVGSRVKGDCESGALTGIQRFGNWLSCRLMRIFFGVEYSDLGPFRALRWESLQKLEMDDTAYGWTVQMQVRAARLGMKITEVPVTYRNRAAGKSKVSGTFRGIVGAGTTILYVIFREALDATRSEARCFRQT